MPTVVVESAAAAQLAIDDVGSRELPRLLLTGELDVCSVPSLEAAVSRCCTRPARAITLDLRGLTFIDSSGLWTITAARRWCERQGYGFSLIPGPKPVHEVFEVTGLSDLLPFREAEKGDVKRSSLGASGAARVDRASGGP
jgi:anti-sigma B factor antagonist